MNRHVERRESLRVAVVAPCTFPSPRGSQVLIRELAQALAERGHEVHVVTYPHGESLVPLRGIHVHRVRPLRSWRITTNLGWWKVVLDWRLAVALYKVVRRQRIDVIHAHNYEGPVISYFVRWLTAVPVVYHSHNALSDELGYYCKPGWRRWVAQRAGRLLDRHVPRRADFSIALTPELARFLRVQGVRADRLCVIPPGAGPVSISEGSSPVVDSFEGRFVVMYSGNLDAYQDLDVLCQGFAEFQQRFGAACLAVLTHEANWEQRAPSAVKALVRAGRAQVVVVPTFSVVRRLLARADVLVCPRGSWSGFPIKMQNYLAAGRALVVAEGSAKGIVDGESGFIVPNGDARALAEALGRLVTDAALRERLAEGARAAAHNLWTWSRVARRVEEIYLQVGVRPAPGRLRLLSARRPRGLIAASGEHISAGFGTGENS